VSLGKLSSNGPFCPRGYQMKWPMPREANDSPLFHEVSPSRVPAHSFLPDAVADGVELGLAESAGGRSDYDYEQE